MTTLALQSSLNTAPSTPSLTIPSSELLCASCGQRLYDEPTENNQGPNTTTGSHHRTSPVGFGWSRLFSGNSNSNSSAVCASERRLIPLTIPGHVQRGQCLRCTRGKPTDNSGNDNYDDDNNNNHLDDEEEEECLHILEEDLFVNHHTLTSPTVPNSAIYNGEYNAFGEREGLGEMSWSNGDKYKGEFIAGYRHGQGTLTFANGPHGGGGGEYVGEWQCNEMHGMATRRFANGDIYTGQYVHGKRSGPGRFYFANGDLYVGAWCNDQMHGFGRYYYAGGQRFEGTFHNGKRTGMGKLQRLDKCIEVFQYVRDRRIGTGIRWSPDRSKAWRVSSSTGGGGEDNYAQQQSRTTKHSVQKISVADAVSLTYEIEKACTPELQQQELARAAAVSDATDPPHLSSVIV